MTHTSILGLPWQLVEPLLQAACIPYTIQIGHNYNKFFSISTEGYYVGKVDIHESTWLILLYRPMVNSNFEKSKEVIYAKEILEV